ncbi:MAG: hypothetical protein JO217_12650 [Acidobacteriaceae bacterium]|nr:hypothetical protein [Acidobacteriaceae bacterium]
MESHKSVAQRDKSDPDSSGDRRTGSVGERPELAANTTGGDRRSGRSAKGASVLVTKPPATLAMTLVLASSFR